MDKDIAVLKDIALFRNLTPENMKRIMNILHRVTFPENEIIMREGDIGDTVYIITEGTVEVTKSLVIGDADNEESGGNKVFIKIRRLPVTVPENTRTGQRG